MQSQLGILWVNSVYSSVVEGINNKLSSLFNNVGVIQEEFEFFIFTQVLELLN